MVPYQDLIFKHAFVDVSCVFPQHSRRDWLLLLSMKLLFVGGKWWALECGA